MLYNQGRLHEASQICNSILATQAADYKAVLLLAMIERRRGHFASAIHLAKHALQIRPDYADAYINLGAIYRDHGEAALAEEAIQKGLQVAPDHLLGHVILATILEDNNDWWGAEQTTRRLIELDPMQPEFHNSLGSLLQRQGRDKEAEVAFRQALAIRPDFIRARYNLSLVHQFVPGDPEIEALQRHLSQAKLRIKDRIRLNFALGQAHDQTGEYQTAFKYMQEANAAMASISPYDEAELLQHLSDIRAAYTNLPARPKPAVPASGHVPIFVIGPSRSGKTLVESMLARHDGVLALGEGKDFLYAMSEFFHHHGLTDTFPDCLRQVSPDQWSELGRAYLQRIAAIDPEARFSVNTLPGHYKYVGIILDALPESRVIFCQRDAMDNCMRIYFTYYQEAYAYAYDQTTVARYYASQWRLLDFWEQRYGERILRVSYEDLVLNPQAFLTSLADYAGLDAMPSLAGFDLTTSEIGHWRHYASQLTPMRETLGQYAPAYSLPRPLPDVE